MRAAKGDEIGAACEEDRVHVVVAGDGADGDHCHACRSGYFLADTVGERGLVAASERGLFFLGHLAGGDVKAGGSVLYESLRDLQ